MKVDSAPGQKAKVSLTNDELKAKLAAKFGKSIGYAKEKAAAKALEKVAAELELSKKAKLKGNSGNDHTTKEGFGDVKLNNPKSEDTRDKLRGILKMGAFSFSDKEKAALGDILN